MNQHSSMNRRDFLGTAAGLTLALTILPDPFAGTNAAIADASLSPASVLGSLTVDVSMPARAYRQRLLRVDIDDVIGVPFGVHGVRHAADPAIEVAAVGRRRLPISHG